MHTRTHSLILVHALQTYTVNISQMRLAEGPSAKITACFRDNRHEFVTQAATNVTAPLQFIPPYVFSHYIYASSFMQFKVVY